jgi:hypothetical protein
MLLEKQEEELETTQLGVGEREHFLARHGYDARPHLWECKKDAQLVVQEESTSDGTLALAPNL